MEIGKTSKVLAIDDNHKNSKKFNYIYILNKKIEEKKSEGDGEQQPEEKKDKKMELKVMKKLIRKGIIKIKIYILFQIIN